MNVEVIAATRRPMDLISQCAGVCYGKFDVSHKRVANCYNNAHMSVFEHASVTFYIAGISRACLAQLTRHRLASYSVESQRYCKVDTNNNDWYVMPQSFVDNSDDEWRIDEERFRHCMDFASELYWYAICDGIKREDARYLLPSSTKTNLAMTMNVRELFAFLDLRQDKHAQWEIREMADAMEKALKERSGQWRKLMEMRSEQ